MITTRMYVFKLVAWLALYAILLAVSIGLMNGQYVTATALRAVVGILPMIAGFGILDLAMRQHRANDEMQQKITAEAIMFAFGATALVTFTYGFLQVSVGAPNVSYFFVWPILATSWIVGTVLAQRRYR